MGFEPISELRSKLGEFAQVSDREVGPGRIDRRLPCFAYLVEGSPARCSQGIFSLTSIALGDRGANQLTFKQAADQL